MRAPDGRFADRRRGAAMTETPSPPRHREPPSLRTVRWHVVLLALALLVVGAVTLALVGSGPHRLVRSLSGLHGVTAPLLVCAVALLALALAPASLIAAAVGAVAGAAAGFPIALGGLGASAAVAAAATRASTHRMGSMAVGRRAARASGWLERRPLRSVVIARAVPGTPFGPVSYSLGLTNISLRIILVGSVVGFAPRALIYTATGTALSNPHGLAARLGLAGSATLVAMSIVGLPLYARARGRVDRRER